MKFGTTKVLLLVATFLLLALFNCSHDSKPAAEGVGTEQYVCVPCGNDCDKIVMNGPGTCSHCQMKLVKKSSPAFKEIQPDDLCSYIASHPQTLLLDVRTKDEFDGKSFPDYGTLKNALNIPIQELETRLPELTAYKNKEILVYCSHSQRSPRASYMLTQNGFTTVLNMAGGLSELDDDSCKR